MLGRVDGLKGYHDVTRHPDAKRIPGLVLFRWDAPLFFANAEIFHEHVLQAVADAPTPAKWVVVAAEPVTDVDITAADALSELDDELQRAGIELCFAEMKGPVKDRLEALRPVHQTRRRVFLPHHRPGGRCVLAGASGASGRTGKTASNSLRRLCERSDSLPFLRSLQRAAAYLQAGKPQLARPVLIEVVKQQPNSKKAGCC